MFLITPREKYVNVLLICKEAIYDISKFIHVYLYLKFKVAANMYGKLAINIRKMARSLVLEGVMLFQQMGSQGLH